MDLNRNVWKVIFFVIIAGLLFIGIYQTVIGKSNASRIPSNHIVICGTIDQVLGGKSITLIYVYEYEGKHYEHTITCPPRTYQKYKEGKMGLLIVMEKGEPNNVRILDEPDDFEKYEITEHDTLNVHCN